MVVRLPIEKVTEEEFNSVFKPKYLDKRNLDEESKREIRRAFDIGGNNVAHVSCDEYHAHRYECLYYSSPIAGTVERLILELKKYQDFHKEIGERIRSLLEV